MLRVECQLSPYVIGCEDSERRLLRLHPSIGPRSALLHGEANQCVVPFTPLTPRSDILLSLTPDDFTHSLGGGSGVNGSIII